MASGAKQRAEAERAMGDSPAAAPLAIRVLVLCALILLAAYTAFAAARLRRSEAGAATPAEARLQASAQALAFRAEVLATRLRDASASGAELIRRNPEAAQDAAETTLRLAGPGARAAAVLNAAGLLSAAGQTRDVEWSSALNRAARSGQASWIGGGSPSSRLLYVVATLQTERGRRQVAIAADVSSLIQAEGDEAQVLATRDGAILGSTGKGLALARSLKDVLGAAASIPSKAAHAAASAQARGEGSRVITASAAQGALVATATQSTGAIPLTPAGSRREGWVMLLAPLAIALILSLVLLRQMRRTEVVHRERLESEKRFRLAVEAARCGIWEWRLTDDSVLMSDVTGVMLGWGGAGVASTEQVLERIAPEHRERVRQALRGAQSFGALDVSFRVPGPNGEGGAWIDARGQSFGEAGARGYTSLLGVALDVTAERTTERRAQLAERRLNDAIESVSEGFVLWDRTGRLVLCNQPYRDFFGLEARMTKPGAIRATVLKFAELAIKLWAPGEDGVRREAQLQDGRWLQISERRTAEGGMVMTAADITTIKEQEEARRLNEEALQAAVDRLEESRKRLQQLAEENAQEKMRAEAANRAKSEFLANMSHELRTPLNAINGFSEMMVAEMFGPVGDGRYKDYAADILSSGQHLLALINDILDMSKIEAGKLALRFEPVDLQDVIEDAARLMRNRAEAAGLKLTIEADPTLPEMEADYRALKQILLNLLSNALKFTPRGGDVAVSASLLADPRGVSRVRLSVRDTGIGIAADDISRLARPFEQIETQHAKTTQGTGLGLALTKSLVELHGGVLEIASTPGQGTTVSLTLPVRRARAALPAAAEAA